MIVLSTLLHVMEEMSFTKVMIYYGDVLTTHPQNPSSLYSLGRPSRKVLLHPGCVWIRTFNASHGAKPMSAKNSALAEAAK